MILKKTELIVFNFECLVLSKIPQTKHSELRRGVPEGTKKWGAGPAGVALTMQGPWVVGALAQNLWSFAGDSDRADVNQMLVQYFINYNLPHGWYLTSAPIITANWEADSDDRWTIPFGAGVGRLIFLDKLPLNMQVGGYYNVKKPDNIGPRWTLRCQIQTLLPKSLFGSE